MFNVASTAENISNAVQLTAAYNFRYIDVKDIISPRVLRMYVEIDRDEQRQDSQSQLNTLPIDSLLIGFLSPTIFLIINLLLSTKVPCSIALLCKLPQFCTNLKNVTFSTNEKNGIGEFKPKQSRRQGESAPELLVGAYAAEPLGIALRSNKKKEKKKKKRRKRSNVTYLLSICKRHIKVAY